MLTTIADRDSGAALVVQDDLSLAGCKDVRFPT